MLILIPATQYDATVEGSVIKHMTCEDCGQTYSYAMSQIVSGSEKVLFSSSQESEKAQAELAKALETEHGNVLCPACKCYQPAHIAYVRRQSYPELKALADAFFIFAKLAFGLILAFYEVLCFAASGFGMPKLSLILECALIILVIASPGLLLRGFRSLLLLNYPPNKDLQP